MNFFFNKNREKQEEGINVAINAHKDTVEWEEGRTRRSMADLYTNDSDIKSLDIKDQHDAFYSVYDRGDREQMKLYVEMLAKKLKLHSDAIDDKLGEAKFSAAYINPFKAFLECANEGSFGKATASLLFSPFISTLAASFTLSSGIDALKEKIKLRRTEQARNLAGGTMTA